MNRSDREKLWVTLSNCWLDTEFDDNSIKHFAEVVVQSGASRDEILNICKYELGPFLHVNGLSVAGEWGGYDESWVIAEASKRHKHRSLGARISGATGLSLFPATDVLNRICEIAFGNPVGYRTFWQ